MGLVRPPAKVAVLAVAALVAACGNLAGQRDAEKGASDPEPGTWGHLSGDRPSWLVQLPPHARIGVCSEGGIDLLTPLGAWARAADRGDRLSFVASCDSEGVDRQITVLDTRDDAAKKTCESLGDVGGFALVTVGVVVICLPEEAVPVSLHEVGHLWGMCDVYPLASLADEGTRAAADNCDPAWFTGRDRYSVMGASYARTLAVGDVEGIKALAARADVSGNEPWRASVALTPPGRDVVEGARSGGTTSSFNPRREMNERRSASDAGLVDADPEVVTEELITDLMRSAEALTSRRPARR